MDIKVLGGGCAKCDQLEAIVKEVLTELGVNATVEHITDFSVIARYGVMATPGLVIDDVVKFSGSVPKKSKVTEIITTELAKRG